MTFIVASLGNQTMWKTPETSQVKFSELDSPGVKLLMHRLAPGSRPVAQTTNSKPKIQKNTKRNKERHDAGT